MHAYIEFVKDTTTTAKVCENSCLFWFVSFYSQMAQLPPKAPNMSSWPDFSSHQKNNNNYHQHQNQNQNPSWVDEFLDFSSARRGAHRRSVSDSVTFLETTSPMLDGGGKHCGNENHEFDKFDDEQFMSMFTDEISGVHNMPPTLSSSNPSSPSDVNDEKEKEKETKEEVNEKEKAEEEDEKKNQQQQLKNEPDIEVESQCKQEETTHNNPISSNDRITDPKRVKR